VSFVITNALGGIFGLQVKIHRIILWEYLPSKEKDAEHPTSFSAIILTVSYLELSI